MARFEFYILHGSPSWAGLYLSTRSQLCPEACGSDIDPLGSASFPLCRKVTVSLLVVGNSCGEIFLRPLRFLFLSRPRYVLIICIFTWRSAISPHPLSLSAFVATVLAFSASEGEATPPKIGSHATQQGSDHSSSVPLSPADWQALWGSGLVGLGSGASRDLLAFRFERWSREQASCWLPSEAWLLM